MIRRFLLTLVVLVLAACASSTDNDAADAGTVVYDPTGARECATS